MAIIFLSIMLVLTFFSNTIMNYSLPEVATQYVQSGSITAKVRGTGTIEASDPYNLIVNDTRVIESIPVKVGDVVEKGDTLFMLEGKESEELKTAREELISLEVALDSAVLAYEAKILDGTISAGTIAGVQTGNTDSLATAQAKVQAAKDKVANLESTKAGYEATLVNIASQETFLANATTYDAAEKEAAVNEATKQLNEAQADLDKAAAEVAALESWFTVAGAGSQAVANDNEAQAEKMMNDAKLFMDNVKGKYDGEPDGECNPTDSGEQEYYKKVIGKTWKVAYDIAKEDYNTALNNYNSAKEIASNYSTKMLELANAQSAKVSAEQEVAGCNETIKNLQAGSSSTDVAEQQKALADQKAQVTAAMANIDVQIAQAQEEQTQVLADVAGELNLEFQSEEIARAREKVEEKKEEIAELEEEANNSVMEAPVSGTIMSLSYASGETTVPGEVAAVIQVAGKGFTTSFSVTNEQAKKVKVGDVAELQNSWYYEDLTATLTAIKPDTTNPSQNKLLVFEVTGADVTAGQSISLSVGQRSADYELIVPNSAIREDNNGKFILIVESKSSPLGNRYIATRVDVEVLASDDTQTAISGALYGYEYVITTATKPVEAGKQVRLTD